MGGFNPVGAPNTVYYPLGLVTTPQNTFWTIAHIAFQIQRHGHHLLTDNHMQVGSTCLQICRQTDRQAESKNTITLWTHHSNLDKWQARSIKSKSCGNWKIGTKWKLPTHHFTKHALLDRRQWQWPKYKRSHRSAMAYCTAEWVKIIPQYWYTLKNRQTHNNNVNKVRSSISSVVGVDS